jgi:signal transduction histidine kinase
MRMLETRQSIHRQLASAEQKKSELAEQLRQAQCLSGLGMAWAITAHEVNNLLTPMTNYARLALQYPDDTALCKKALEKAAFLGQRAGEILEKIMTIASGKSLEMTRTAVDVLLDDVQLCIGRDFAKDGIRVIRDCPTGITVWGDRAMLCQAILNLVLNARRVMLDKGGELRITACLTSNGTEIEIADTGCGMTPEVLSHIFKPFYTTAENNKNHDGNGLGLVFCKQIVEAHDGSIQVESVPGQGTVFRLRLPNN